MKSKMRLCTTGQISSRMVVQSFVVLCHDRKFIWGFYRILDKLHTLSENRRTFLWSPECTKTFLEFEKSVMTAPVLTLLCLKASNIGPRCYHIWLKGSIKIQEQQQQKKP